MYTVIVPGVGFLPPLSCVPGVCPGRMVLDEIDSCITFERLMRSIIGNVVKIVKSSTQNLIIEADDPNVSILHGMLRS